MKASSPYAAEFEEEIATWPTPIELRHQEGDIYVTLLPHKNYMEAKWNGHVTAADTVTAAKVYLALLQTYHCPDRLLNDKTNVTGDWSEANDWLEFEWLPQVIRAGMHYMAHIYSSNMFSRLSARDLFLRVTPRLQMQNFNNRKEGLHWLLTCSPPQLEQSA